MKHEDRRTQEWRSEQWLSLMTEQYRPLEHAIASRPHPTITDCVELAESIWHSLPKKQIPMRNGDWQYEVDSGVLGVGADGSDEAHHFTTPAYHCREASVALVEAVLTLGNGERRGQKTAQGVFPQATRSASLASKAG